MKIQTRGRWACNKSVMRHKKHGPYLRVLESLTKAEMKKATAAPEKIHAAVASFYKLAFEGRRGRKTQRGEKHAMDRAPAAPVRTASKPRQASRSRRQLPIAAAAPRAKATVKFDADALTKEVDAMASECEPQRRGQGELPCADAAKARPPMPSNVKAEAEKGPSEGARECREEHIATEFGC